MSFTTTIKISVNKNHTLRAHEYTFSWGHLLQLQETGPEVNTPQVAQPTCSWDKGRIYEDSFPLLFKQNWKNLKPGNP